LTHLDQSGQGLPPLFITTCLFSLIYAHATSLKPKAWSLLKSFTRFDSAGNEKPQKTIHPVVFDAHQALHFHPDSPGPLLSAFCFRLYVKELRMA
jgi:hypothetical protein